MTEDSSLAQRASKGVGRPSKINFQALRAQISTGWWPTAVGDRGARLGMVKRRCSLCNCPGGYLFKHGAMSYGRIIGPMLAGGSILRQGKRKQSWPRSAGARILAGRWAHGSSSVLWKSRWTGDWFLRRAVDQPNRGRIQNNQILISAHAEVRSQTGSYNCSMIVNFLSVPELLVWAGLAPAGTRQLAWRTDTIPIPPRQPDPSAH